MNTTKLKSFAPKVRVQRMEAVSRKLDAVLMGDTVFLQSFAIHTLPQRYEMNEIRRGVFAFMPNHFLARRFCYGK